MWAVFVAGLDMVLDYLKADLWLYVLSYFGDACTSVIVISFIVRDLQLSLQQMWRRDSVK